MLIKKENKKYLIKIDDKKFKDIRKTINEYNNLAVKKKDIFEDQKNNFEYKSWDRTCAIMDRLEDTTDYLNKMELGKDLGYRSAFDFYDYLNCVYVIIECLMALSNIYNVSKEEIKKIDKISDCFKEYMEVESSDGKFFRYIRSLCAVHPVSTTRHKSLLNGSKIHCCPFTIWNNTRTGMFLHREKDLSVRIYDSKSKGWGKSLELNIESFDNYLSKWINLSGKIIIAIHNYYNTEFEKMRKILIKSPKDFDSYVDYLIYLKTENTNRYNNDEEYIFDYYIMVFKTKLTNYENNIKFEKYKNAIKYALEFKSKAIQDAIFDGFDYTGIVKPKHIVDNTLFYEIESPERFNTKFIDYTYNLEKMLYIEDSEYEYGEYDKSFARDMLDEMKELVNKYVVFNNNEPDNERVILVKMAQYFCNLEIESDLNNSIPKNEKYR